MKIKFKRVQKEDLPELLDDIDTYYESPRWDRSQLEKYLSSSKSIDDEEHSAYFGLFRANDDSCLALAYLNKVPDGFILIAQVNSVVKGYGRKLIDVISGKASNLWLAADPAGGETLLEYYRTFDCFKEIRLKHSKWVAGQPESFFYKTSDAEREDELVDWLRNSAEMRSPAED